MTDYSNRLEAIAKSLNLPVSAEEIMLDSLYVNLKSRVGMRLALEMSEDNLRNIEPILTTSDPKTVIEDLTSVVPNLDRIINEEIEGLKRELEQ